MDIPKTALVKSKSSNSTSEAKKNAQKKEKISKSHAEFQTRRLLCTGVQPLMLKKRGVYVEKKPMKISINNCQQSPDVPRNQPLMISPRPIPRPSKKRFLTSVLSILSKSTAGTQFPEDIEAGKIDKTMNKLKLRRGEQDIHEEGTGAQNISKKKFKYRSRILNNQANRDSFTVLQSKKDIAQTSSNNSEYINAKYDANSVDPDTIKWAESLPPLDKDHDSTASIASHSQKVKLTNKTSATSLVSDVPKEFDRGIYDFFVDVLKTMNYGSEDLNKQQVLTSVISSKLSLHIDDSARQLNKRKGGGTESPTFAVSRKVSSQHAYCILPDERDQWNHKQMLEHFQSQLHNYPHVKKQPSPMRRKRKPKSDSFQYKASAIPKTTSLPMPSKKKPTKKSTKKDFLKLLKEELQMKSKETFEEPQNFYEALKLIARNKRLSQEWKSEVPSDPDDHICQFKPRRVLSRKPSGKPSSYYSEPRSSRYNGMTSSKKRKVVEELYDYETDYSHHSLEVTGYDYEEVKKPTKKPKKSNISFMSRPQTPPADDFWAEYDSDAEPMLVQRQYVLDKLRLIE